MPAVKLIEAIKNQYLARLNSLIGKAYYRLSDYQKAEQHYLTAIDTVKTDFENISRTSFSHDL